jgi:hypothetical protein
MIGKVRDENFSSRIPDCDTCWKCELRFHGGSAVPGKAMNSVPCHCHYRAVRCDDPDALVPAVSDEKLASALAV